MGAKFAFHAGDVLAFRGTDPVSRLIQVGTYITTGPWLPVRLPPSHVGIIAEVRGEMMLVESTTLSRRPCLESHRLHDGVQVQRPLERIADYKGACEVWRLVPMHSLSAGESCLLTKICLDYFVGYKVSYDMLRAAVSGTRVLKFFGNPDPKKAFCSELCYALLDRLGRLPPDNAARHNPASLIKTLRRCGRVQLKVRRWQGDEPYLV